MNINSDNRQINDCFNKHKYKEQVNKWYKQLSVLKTTKLMITEKKLLRTR